MEQKKLIAVLEAVLFTMGDSVEVRKLMKLRRLQRKKSRTLWRFWHESIRQRKAASVWFVLKMRCSCVRKQSIMNI